MVGHGVDHGGLHVKQQVARHRLAAPHAPPRAPSLAQPCAPCAPPRVTRAPVRSSVLLSAARVRPECGESAANAAPRSAAQLRSGSVLAWRVAALGVVAARYAREHKGPHKGHARDEGDAPPVGSRHTASAAIVRERTGARALQPRHPACPSEGGRGRRAAEAAWYCQEAAPSRRHCQDYAKTARLIQRGGATVEGRRRRSDTGPGPR